MERILKRIVPDLRGDCSELRGDCSGLQGDCTGLQGDLDQISQEDRKKGIEINSLVEEVKNEK